MLIGASLINDRAESKNILSQRASNILEGISLKLLETWNNFGNDASCIKNLAKIR